MVKEQVVKITLVVVSVIAVASNGTAQTTAFDFYKSGNAKHAAGDFYGAIEDYDRALALEPKHPSGYNNRGNSKFDIGDFDGALKDYNRALELEPSHASAYINRGNLKNAKGDLNGALADYNRAIELDPKRERCTTIGGRSNRKKGDPCRAQSQITIRQLALDPRSAFRFHVSRASAELEPGDFAVIAAADCERAIALDPRYVPAYVSRGDLKLAKGDLNGAFADYNRALKLDPKHAVAYSDRGDANFVARNWRAALDDYNRFFEVSKKNQDYPRLCA